MNLMVTANQKPVIDTQDKQSKENTKYSHQSTRDEIKRKRKEQKRTTKTTRNQSTKWQ